MENEEKFEKNNKIDKFKEKYIEMVNTFKYNEEEEEMLCLDYGLDELSAYEMREKTDIRTEGGSFIFSLRISKELDALGIENYLVEEEKENEKYWLNLYKCDGIWYIADLTDDILTKQYLEQNNELVEKEPECADIHAVDFLLGRTSCKTLEAIKDDGKKIEELKRYSLQFCDIAEDKVNDELEKSVVAVEDKITFKMILQELKEAIKRMKQDKEEGKGILAKIEKILKGVSDKIKNIYEDITGKIEEETEEEIEDGIEEIEDAQTKEVENRNTFKEELKVEGIRPEEIGEKTEILETEKNIGDNTKENIVDNIEENIEDNTERDD